MFHIDMKLIEENQVEYFAHEKPWFIHIKLLRSSAIH